VLVTGGKNVTVEERQQDTVVEYIVNAPDPIPKPGAKDRFKVFATDRNAKYGWRDGVLGIKVGDADPIPPVDGIVTLPDNIQVNDGALRMTVGGQSYVFTANSASDVDVAIPSVELTEREMEALPIAQPSA